MPRGSTFEAVLKWQSDLDRKVLLPKGNPIPAVILANKYDQKRDDDQSPPQIDQLCKRPWRHWMV
jgi:Ras-related protein Rab-32